MATSPTVVIVGPAGAKAPEEFSAANGIRYLHVEHWANALNQGPAVAGNMLGVPTREVMT
jgi:hypothetical protein